MVSVWIPRDSSMRSSRARTWFGKRAMHTGCSSINHQLDVTENCVGGLVRSQLGYSLAATATFMERDMQAILVIS